MEKMQSHLKPTTKIIAATGLIAVTWLLIVLIFTCKIEFFFTSIAVGILTVLLGQLNEE